jgi:hypothetical protein
MPTRYQKATKPKKSKKAAKKIAKETTKKTVFVQGSKFVECFEFKYLLD